MAAAAVKLRDWTEFYVQHAREVCSTVFKNNELHEKHWQHIERMSFGTSLLATAGGSSAGSPAGSFSAGSPTSASAEGPMEPSVFWTIAIHHPQLQKVLHRCIEDAERSLHSNKDRISSAQQKAIVLLVTRLVLSFDPSFTPRQELRTAIPSPTSLNTRLSSLLPAHVLLPLTLVLFRHSPVRAGVVLTGLLLQAPTLLKNIHAVFQRWCDSMEDIGSGAVQEAKRGRFQRRPQDILCLVERAYKGVRQLWALFHSCPFVVQYTTLDRLMNALRTVVDTTAPLLQYFIMTCEQLAPRRPQLAKAIAAMVNSAVDVGVIALLFTAFAGGKEKKSLTGFLQPMLISRVDSALMDYMQQHTTGLLGALLKRHSPQELLRQLVPPGEHNDAGKPLKLGPILLSTITSSQRYSAGMFGVQVMTALVRHKISLEGLVDSKFLLRDEAQKLGAAEETGATNAALEASNVPATHHQQQEVQPGRAGGGGKQNAEEDELDDDTKAAIAASLAEMHQAEEGQGHQLLAAEQRAAEAAGRAKPRVVATAAPQQQQKPRGKDDADQEEEEEIARQQQQHQQQGPGSRQQDPSVAMVHEVLPHIPPSTIVVALEYYKQNTEELINDALMGNLPPHLQELFDRSTAEALSSAVSTTTAPAGGAQAPAMTTTSGTSIHQHHQAAEQPQASPLLPQVDFGCDMHTFLSSELHHEDLTEAIASESVPQATAGSGSFSRTGTGGSLRGAATQPGAVLDEVSGEYMVPLPSTISSEDLFAVDDEMRDRVRLLSEMIYEDEYDDTEEDPHRQYQQLAGGAGSDSEEEDEPKCAAGSGSSNPPFPSSHQDPATTRGAGSSAAGGATHQAGGGKKHKSTGAANSGQSSSAAGKGGKGGGGSSYGSKPKSLGDRHKMRMVGRQQDRDKRRGAGM